MDAIKRNNTDLRLHILLAVRSPAKFAHDDIATAIGCELSLVEEIAEMASKNPEPTNPMTQEEIAQIIGVSAQAVRNIEHIALQRLRHPRRMKMLMPLRDAAFA
jgi:DNA-binding CsgD family transcriptional regulator